MVATTFIAPSEKDKITSSHHLNCLLREVRAITGKDYQLVETIVNKRSGLFNLKETQHSRMQLYCGIDSRTYYQVISCAYNEATITGFLYGVLNGYDIGNENTA